MVLQINSINNYNRSFKGGKKSTAKLVSEMIGNEISLSRINHRQETLLAKVNRQQGLLKNKSLAITESNGLDKFIVGYNNTKNKIIKNLIDPLLSSSSLFDFYLPSGFLLAGHKEITSEFVSGIKHEISDSVNIKDFSNLDINNKFNDNIIKLLQNAREFFLETGKRTVMFSDNAERFLSFPAKIAGILGRKLNKKDLQVLGDTNNMASVNLFKSLLDDVSKLPQKENSYLSNFATIFVLSTENPHLIHPDLSKRSGKLDTIYMGLPQGENLKDIILTTINKYNPNFRDYFSKEDWKIILKELNPNSHKGGLSISQIEALVHRFYSNPNNNFNNFSEELMLLRILLNNKRAISPQICEKDSQISRIFSDTENNNLDNFEPEEFILLRELGLLSPKLEQVFEQYKENLEQELNYLNSKHIHSKLSKKESKRKQLLENLLNKD